MGPSLQGKTFSVTTQFTVSTGKRVNFRDECHWSHACKSFKRTCMGSNGILYCKFLSENAHRAPKKSLPGSSLGPSNSNSVFGWKVTKKTGKRSGRARGMLLVTRMRTSCASGRAKVCRAMTSPSVTHVKPRTPYTCCITAIGGYTTSSRQFEGVLTLETPAGSFDRVL
jgi:hypothetical protein